LIVDRSTEDFTISSFCAEFGHPMFSESFSERAIDFLASHFNEFDLSFLNNLSVSTLCQILSHQSLQLENEDSLYNFIRSHLESNPTYISLLEFIRFEFLTCETTKNFILWSFEHFEEISGSFSLWKSISGRLSQEVHPEAISRYLGHVICFKSNSPLNGIIAYLSSSHGGNVSDRDIISVSASSVYSSNQAKNAADLQSTNCFHSTNNPNQWLCYDFKDRRVQPTHYSIHAYSSNYFLRSWIIEGSLNNSEWISLDERTNNTEADSSHPIVTFTISRSMKCRFIRLRQTGVNQNGNHYLILFAFEVFGHLTE
jgi:hypothetical protein